MAKVIRILVLEGDAEWINTTLKKSAVNPDAPLSMGMGSITEILRYPELPLPVVRTESNVKIDPFQRAVEVKHG